MAGLTPDDFHRLAQSQSPRASLVLRAVAVGGYVLLDSWFTAEAAFEGRRGAAWVDKTVDRSVPLPHMLCARLAAQAAYLDREGWPGVL